MKDAERIMVIEDETVTELEKLGEEDCKPVNVLTD